MHVRRKSGMVEDDEAEGGVWYLCVTIGGTDSTHQASLSVLRV